MRKVVTEGNPILPFHTRMRIAVVPADARCSFADRFKSADESACDKYVFIKLCSRAEADKRNDLFSGLAHVRKARPIIDVHIAVPQTLRFWSGCAG